MTDLYLAPATETCLHRASVPLVLRIVSSEAGVSVARLVGRQRTRHVARPRQIIYGLLWSAGTLSSTEIGRMIGDRHHTTVLSGIKRAEELRKTDPEFDALYRACEARFEGTA